MHATRLRLLLAMLDESRVVEDMIAPGLRLTVQANWRMIFKFDAGDAFVVDYLDYH